MALPSKRKYEMDLSSEEEEYESRKDRVKVQDKFMFQIDRPKAEMTKIDQNIQFCNEGKYVSLCRTEYNQP